MCGNMFSDINNFHTFHLETIELLKLDLLHLKVIKIIFASQEFILVYGIIPDLTVLSFGGHL
jgi:hypothetical protein